MTAVTAASSSVTRSSTSRCLIAASNSRMVPRRSVSRARMAVFMSSVIWSLRLIAWATLLMLCVENANDGWPDFNLMLDLRLLGSRLLLSILLDSSLHVSSLHVSSLHVSSLIIRSRFLPALKQKPACGRFLKRDHDHVPDAESHRVKSAKR